MSATLKRSFGQHVHGGHRDSKSPAQFPGSSKPSFINRLEFVDNRGFLPIYRVIDEQGKVLAKDQEPKLPKTECVEIYRKMVLLRSMDEILYEAQRQGRISFYLTSHGEEATVIGSAAAIPLVDMVFGQYREAGVLLWRGFTLGQFMNQCLGNEYDNAKARQMPVHYGSKELNFQTISSPLTTQLLHAVGAAYVFKQSRQNRCAICYFGEGAASEGDFHAALNFAATLECPVIFFCRNNGFAISTTVREQYRGDAIAGRGIAYGIPSLRMDGNDIWAVYNATLAARNRVLETRGPVLLEAMTYRVGHHSTSDDSSAYRSRDEIAYWAENDNPLQRMRKYLEDRQWWNDEQERQFLIECRQKVTSALHEAEKAKKPAIEHLFTDVYDRLPSNLQEQQKSLKEHLANYPNEYTLDQYATNHQDRSQASPTNTTS
jgi:2-oxoisovalerate dehydrogenase E1 component alpha subunit